MLGLQRLWTNAKIPNKSPKIIDYQFNNTKVQYCVYIFIKKWVKNYLKNDERMFKLMCDFVIIACGFIFVSK